MTFMESRMRRDSHVRFGGRLRETDGQQCPHRARSRPYCGQCDATKSRLDKRSIEYQSVDITEDDTARHYVTRTLGYLQAPVVVVDEDTHWSGFRIDAIDKLAAA